MTTERRCVCSPYMNARECARSRYSPPYMPDGDGDIPDLDDECECYCHVEQRAADQEQDDLDRQGDLDDYDGFW